MTLDIRLLARAVVEEVDAHPSHASQALDAAVHLLEQHGQHSALRSLPRMLRQAQRRYGKSQMVRVEVPTQLTETEHKALVSTLEKASGRPVTLEEEAMPALIGGARLRVGDERLDASLSGDLSRLSQLFTSSSSLPS